MVQDSVARQTMQAPIGSSLFIFSHRLSEADRTPIRLQRKFGKKHLNSFSLSKVSHGPIESKCTNGFTKYVML